MEESHLRIGNILYFPFIDKNVTIIGINALESLNGIEYKISFKEGNNMYYEPLSVLRPVTLTKELALAQGCSNLNGNSDILFMNYFGFCLDFDGEDWCVKPRANEPYLICYIKYLHELQNIFFSLSREELTDKE